MKKSKKVIISVIVAIILSHGPIGGFVVQSLVTVCSYIGICVGSLFSNTLREDMNKINYNPFNSDESKVISSNSVSFYKGVPFYKTSNERSGSFCAVLLYSEEDDTETIKHEIGHNVQQLILGPITFLINIGITSMFELSTREYYDRPWEITADLFGGVSTFHNDEDIKRGKGYIVTSLFTGPFSYFYLIGEY